MVCVHIRKIIFHSTRFDIFESVRDQDVDEAAVNLLEAYRTAELSLHLTMIQTRSKLPKNGCIEEFYLLLLHHHNIIKYYVITLFIVI